MSHRTLAQHYYLDALDLHKRFITHWEDQPRVSARVKSFIDLLMACECMLKAQCLIAKSDTPLKEAYRQVKVLGHDIAKLSVAAEATLQAPSEVHSRAREYFASFSVCLRYSVDAHLYFFPLSSNSKHQRSNYQATLGNQEWRNAAEAVVIELLKWGRNHFTGELTDSFEVVMLKGIEVETAITSSSRRSPHQGPKHTHRNQI